MNRLCPTCSCSNKNVLFKQEFYTNSICLMSSYKVVACDDCGFCFADEIPTQTEFNLYYEQMSKYEYDRYDNFPSSDQLKHYTKIVNLIEPYLIDKEVSILDMGCSTGGLLSIFKQKKYGNLLGIDPSESCVNSVKRLYGIEAQVNNFSDLKEGKKHDLVVLSEVLEHIVDLNDILAKMQNILSDNGLLFVEVPDSGRWDAQISAPFQQFSVEHINYFSQCSLINLLAKNGFDTLTLTQGDYISEKINEPVIMLLARKGTANKNNSILNKDSIQPIKKYVDKCLKNDKKLKSTIHDKISKLDQIIVWGVGTHTLRLLEHGIDISKIKYFVDSNTRYVGKTIHGLEIKAPKDIQDKDTPILISTYFYQQEITHQIRDALQLNNSIITMY